MDLSPHGENETWMECKRDEVDLQEGQHENAECGLCWHQKFHPTTARPFTGRNRTSGLKQLLPVETTSLKKRPLDSLFTQPSQIQRKASSRVRSAFSATISVKKRCRVCFSRVSAKSDRIKETSQRQLTWHRILATFLVGIHCDLIRFISVWMFWSLYIPVEKCTSSLVQWILYFTFFDSVQICSYTVLSISHISKTVNHRRAWPCGISYCSKQNRVIYSLIIGWEEWRLFESNMDPVSERIQTKRVQLREHKRNLEKFKTPFHSISTTTRIVFWRRSQASRGRQTMISHLVWVPTVLIAATIIHWRLSMVCSFATRTVPRVSSTTPMSSLSMFSRSWETEEASGTWVQLVSLSQKKHGGWFGSA